MSIPADAMDVQVAFLPPLSGLSSNETRLDPGAINVRVGEGRTAEVLRNLCFRIHQENPDSWDRLVAQIDELFGIRLEYPRYIQERGEIDLSYTERGIELDVSSSGRGLQQTLLLISYMYSNPGAVLLLDEPDAHLEILRQRQIYQLLTETALDQGNQIIAASHSEVLLNEAAGRDVVIAFVGSPHRIDDRGTQVLKSPKEIGFEQYYQAEQMGWVLYLEGATDLAILRAFARILDHRTSLSILERPFVHYIGNNPNEALRHFYGIREAIPRFRGLAILDRMDPPPDPNLVFAIWTRREIENYLCYPETLRSFASQFPRAESAGPLFEEPEVRRRTNAMEDSIQEVSNALAILRKASPWDPGTKVSDDFLTPLFEKFYQKLGSPNIMAKKNFHELARFVPAHLIDAEIAQKLDAIVSAASSPHL